MTSKLRRTIVGVGIALGGAAPACFGRTAVTEISSFEDSDDPEATDVPDAPAPDGGVPDMGPPRRADAGDSVGPDSSLADTGMTEPNPSDAALPDAALPDGALADAGADFDADVVDAASDAMDPFCDVTWPPTKGFPTPPTAPCVDPLNECRSKRAYPPRGCFKLLAPDVCSFERTWEGPLYCIDGEWRCPPGTTDGPRCVCFGPLQPGETCTDGGVSGP